MDNTLSTDAGLPGLEEMIHIVIIRLVAKVWVPVLMFYEFSSYSADVSEKGGGVLKRF